MSQGVLAGLATEHTTLREYVQLSATAAAAAAAERTHSFIGCQEPAAPDVQAVASAVWAWIGWDPEQVSDSANELNLSPMAVATGVAFFGEGATERAVSSLSSGQQVRLIAQGDGTRCGSEDRRPPSCPTHNDVQPCFAESARQLWCRTERAWAAELSWGGRAVAWERGGSRGIGSCGHREKPRVRSPDMGRARRR